MMQYIPSYLLSFSQEQSTYLTEIKSIFIEYLNLSQSSQISFYPREVFSIRAQVINWLIFICKRLSLSLDTLFHCVHLFDKYISLSSLSTLSYSLYDINLTCIACLSLATKEEEVNCNYIKFFTENILNTPLNELRRVKDVALKELEILKALKFKTRYINAFHFNKLYLEIFKGSRSLMYYAKAINEEIILLYLSSDCYLNYSPYKIALFAFEETLLKLSIYYLTAGFKDNNILCQQIIAFHQMSETKETDNPNTINTFDTNSSSCKSNSHNKSDSNSNGNENKRELNHHSYSNRLNDI